MCVSIQWWFCSQGQAGRDGYRDSGRKLTRSAAKKERMPNLFDCQDTNMIRFSALRNVATQKYSILSTLFHALVPSEATQKSMTFDIIRFKMS